MFRQTRLDWFASRNVVRLDRRRNPRSSRSPQRRALRFEPLEDRRLLAITVDTLIDQDDGIGVGGTSLREAIAAATPGEEINFNVTGTIALTHGELLVNKSLTITGPAANLLTIDAGGDSRVLNIDNSTATLASVSISGLTITGGVTGADGGGILNRETLTVFACEITGNSAEDGGGIASFQGTFSLFDSTVSHNSASGANGGGGGIFSFSDNLSDTSTIRNSTLSANDASTTAGGGVYNFHGTLLVQHSTITDNTAHGNLGSGIATLGDVSEAVTIVRSSIVAGNTFSDVDVVVGFETAISSEGFNLVGFGNVTGVFTTLGDQRFATDAIIQLAPLDDYGGPTRTHALLPGSAAIDTGNLSVDSPPIFDQRGPDFLRIADGDDDEIARIDKGAFETEGKYLIVDTLDDESDDNLGVGDLSLREALETANASATNDVILFDPSLSGGTIVLSLGELLIADDVKIDASTLALGLTIDATDNDSTPNDDGGGTRVLVVDEGTFSHIFVTLSGLTLTGADYTNAGGAIFNLEQLNVEDCLLTGNAAKWGGGIYNGVEATVNILRTTISDNSAIAPPLGGLGSGGGLYNEGGYLGLADSIVSGNDSVSDGGGIRNAGYGSLYLLRSTVHENDAVYTGGGIRSDSGFVNIKDSSISHNHSDGSGGGIFNNLSQLSVTQSTIAGNDASYGGGLYLGGTILTNTTIDNCTISGNSAVLAGGGVYNFQGSALIKYSTITNNQTKPGQGGGLAVWSDPLTTSTTIRSTIIAGNEPNSGDIFLADEDHNSITSAGYNLIGTGGGLAAFQEPGDQTGVLDPKLAPLADNGGPTKTHALLPGSPAIDAGDPGLASGEGVPFYDQRGPGFDRIRDGNAAEGFAMDIGAFEVQQFVPGPDLPGDYNLDLTVDAADYTVWRDTLGMEVDEYDGADGDGDGIIGPGDYQVWKDNFGESLSEEGSGLGADSETLALAGSASLDGLIVVTTLDDTVDISDGLTSLREAIFAANIVSGLNTIGFDSALTSEGPAAILLTLGELLITDTVIINGPGADLLTIDASGNDIDANVHGDGTRIFSIDQPLSNTPNIEIRDLTLIGGDSNGPGGAIQSSESILLERLNVVDNWAASGGAIALFVPSGTSTIADCTITSNVAGSNGGAIFLQFSRSTTTIIRDCAIDQNQAGRGGALYVGSGAVDANLIISGTSFSGNSANLQGGAIHLTTPNAPKTSISSSLLSGNSSMQQGGAIFASGVRDLAIVDSRLVENKSLAQIASQGRGGAIYATSNSDVVITGSTISGNTASSGGGVHSRSGELTISFSNVADNAATAGDGGGIYSNLDRLSIVGSTISGNSVTGNFSQLGRGGGLWHSIGPGPATLQDTFLTGNSATNSGGGAFFRSSTYAGGNSVLLSNASISENSAARGGGIAFGDNGFQSGSIMFAAGSIANNTATTNGGGVYGSAYTMLIQGTTITGNHAGGNGGGMATSQVSGRSFASISFVGATIANNSAGTGVSTGSVGVGGGLHIAGGIVLNLLQTSVSQNSARIGGGIMRGVQGGLGGSPPGVGTTVIDSAISGNSSILHGGGIYLNAGSLSLTRSTVANNIASPGSSEILANGGGIFARSTDVTLLESSLTGNSTNSGRGGGIFLDLGIGDLTVTASTIAGNSARQDGGGVWDGATNDRVLIQSSTISDNSSAQGTGGLYLRGNISIRNSTISRNTGGGTRPGGLLAGDGARQLELDHAIVAGNHHASSGPPDLDWFTAAWDVTVRSSLIGDNTSTSLVEAPLGSPDASGNLIGQPLGAGGQGVIDPVLGPLLNNGGRTLTHALLPGSPALDGGALVTLPPLGYDQRGNPFSRMVDGTGDGIIRIDIGAYESQGVPSFSPGDYNRDGNVDACDYGIWRDLLDLVVEPFSGADGDGDGTVDADDYEVWKSHFGQKLVFSTGGGSAALSLLAEPAAEVAFVLAPSLAEPPRIVSATNRVARYSSQFAVLPDDNTALVAWLSRQTRSADSNDEAFADDPVGSNADVLESDAFGDSLDAAFAAFGT